MQITDYIDGLRPSTAVEYRTALRYIQSWQEHSPGTSFADYLGTLPLAAATRVKHLKTAKTLCKRCNIEYNLGRFPEKPAMAAPPKFSDIDFGKLYNAFSDCEHPKFIASGERCRYWQAVIHFAVVTALRREAILGLQFTDIDVSELYLTVPAEIDKKDKTRFKPITSELASQLIDVRRFYDMDMLRSRGVSDKLFPWIHGNKTWYKCWNAAEKIVGKRFRLHDLKRFSGELALRAGASPLELQQHMDHSDIKTTLMHYCRPSTTELVRRFKVPLPQAGKRLTPLFTEPELKDIVETSIVRRLVEAGIDVERLNLALDAFGNVLLGENGLPGDKHQESPERPMEGSANRPYKRASKQSVEERARSAGFRVFWPAEEEGGEL
jgi:integrase